MKIRRTIPPAASPISLRDVARGLLGIFDRRAVGDLEEELRKQFETEHVFLVSSGKAALALILSGLHSISGRTKVLIPAYTCYSVPSAVLRAGLEIVLCDVVPETLDFDYAALKNLADRETLCVVSTHLFGVPSDVSRVRELTAEKGIYIVEDAAQGMGIRSGRKQLGTLGDVGFFSLARGKNVTCGSGGIVLTSSEEIARSIRPLHEALKRETIGEYLKDILEVLFTKMFIHPCVYWLPDGIPFLGIGETRFDSGFRINRMNGFKAGLMRSWRSRLEESNRRRASVAEYYMKELGLNDGAPIYSARLPYLRFPLYGEGPVFKETVCSRYRHLGISPMYPNSLDHIEEIRGGIGKGTFRGAETIASRLLTLPTHALLTGKDMSEICNIVKGSVAHSSCPKSA